MYKVDYKFLKGNCKAKFIISVILFILFLVIFIELFGKFIFSNTITIESIESYLFSGNNKGNIFSIIVLFILSLFLFISIGLFSSAVRVLLRILVIKKLTKSGQLIKNIPYKVIKMENKYNEFFKPYKVSIDYKMPTGEIVSLISDEFRTNNKPYNYVDLLIDLDNYKKYFIGFNISGNNVVDSKSEYVELKNVPFRFEEVRNEGLTKDVYIVVDYELENGKIIKLKELIIEPDALDWIIQVDLRLNLKNVDDYFFEFIGDRNVSK